MQIMYACFPRWTMELIEKSLTGLHHRRLLEIVFLATTILEPVSPGHESTGQGLVNSG